nr:MAG: hypothetical protein [Apis mellifera filamentous virus]
MANDGNWWQLVATSGNWWQLLMTIDDNNSNLDKLAARQKTGYPGRPVNNLPEWPTQPN